ncbi:hypothetical protein [Pseudomonas sp. stari2]|uniref:hypothetical protein n=1 Tax=Pseudomonas sp. Stari2 TaxID=2954814 RepID=UPI00345D8D97
MATHLLEDEITAQTVELIVKDLDEAVDGDEIVILMPHNRGGQVDAAIDLLDSIIATKASVLIEIDRYVISAAAFIYCWFYFKPMEHVSVRTKGEQALIIYHRPRVCISEHIVFLDGLHSEDPYYRYLLHYTEQFDGLFDLMLSEFGYQEANGEPLNHQGSDYTHELHHMRLAYYANQDCVFPA